MTTGNSHQSKSQHVTTHLQSRLLDGLTASYNHAFEVAPGPQVPTQAIMEALTSEKPMIM